MSADGPVCAEWISKKALEVVLKGFLICAR